MNEINKNTVASTMGMAELVRYADKLQSQLEVLIRCETPPWCSTTDEECQGCMNKKKLSKVKE